MSTALSPTDTPLHDGAGIPALVKVFFVADVLVISICVLGFLIGRAVGAEAPEFIRLSRESNLPTAFSGFQLAMVGVLFGCLAVREIRTDIRRFAIALPALLFLFFALDETAMIHERLGDLIAAHLPATKSIGIVNNGVAMLVALPVAIVIVVVVSALTRRYWQGRRRVIVLFVTGIALFLAAAGGLEILVNLFHSHQAWVSLETLVEESLEMVGVTSVLWSAVELLAAEGLTIVFEQTSIRLA